MVVVRGRGVVAAPLLFVFDSTHISQYISTTCRTPPARKCLTINDLYIEKKLKKNLTRKSKRCILVLL